MLALPTAALAGSLIFAAFGAPPAAAQTTLPTADGRGAVAVAPQDPTRPLRGGASQVAANGASIVLEVNKGTLIRLTAPAATVFVANPDIADVQVKSPSLIYISAKAPGETVIYAVDASDSVLLNSPVRVEHDVSRLRSSLRQLAPGEQISASSVDGNLVLSGVVSDAGKADKVRALAASIAGEVKGSQVINRMSVATPNQVNLQVRIAEVDVTKLNEIGVNWQKIGSTIKFMTTNPVTLMAETTNTLIAGQTTGTGVNATISALEQEGFITSLAEPNLTAMSGQTASFLAGGEFPVPISGSSAATGGFPTISVEFKSFGVSLAFTPTVIDANHLNLRVRPEVSELSTVGEVSVPLTNTATVTIPALTVRRAETSVELASGQSFALAGLLMHTSQQLVSKVPWIGDLPIIGAAFRSDRFQRGETDIVVIVTPYLVQPSPTRLAGPTDGLVLPSDAQRVLFSDKYRQGLPAPARGPLDAGGKGLIGPGGFRLD
ncbi:MAG TPA: type II and III secretion system protein family protein [Stellaceae bacterium]|jgi:pilus assembly protein CpaC|nr:type II and III secretion system protein family protein [Stellaceae bacterium]